MKYQTLFLDADETLLDFKRAEAQGLENALRCHQLPFSEEILALYSGINKKCWEEFEQGVFDKDTLLVERFRRLFRALDITADPDAVRRTYHEELGKGGFLIAHADEVCRKLKETHDLYIVTNGVAATQYSRFAISGLDKLVKGIFVSEEVGFPKPQKEYFDYVFAQIPGFQKERALMVGDSLTADITGGINAGLDTCWYNPERKQAPAGMNITYEIHDIRELLEIAG
ncbi:HAD hydrolase, TIGR02254 family [Marvinbryantia formatexigens DSM 14469]|uniref:HAD hydrolase, TIGR02254 family n=1 Tax=Marvinbryantia formatexigens DSM 14469 TaxID=478749 RepID=C6LC84_9FIRM|nr:YjjG family noncanonical pyrimidine nucleotidase [Marvinbryantia formatexigens]EET61548.1 HAD hydrolase, TIGR02254 family [Marvinbryantia formatexigens DSM 14469]UWO24616.1 YjjG family noncanonical pyrimidine nucleotidase [Marvinbryantia formatexigens DSM 14469]SDF15750.1 2-haloacid dehalogenase [Marvinbryantia formatexigens]